MKEMVQKEETIEDNDGILWLNEKHMEEGLDHNVM